jgi:hypothetical protein
VGTASMLKPLSRLWIRTRRAALLFVGFSLVVVIAGMSVPAPLRQAAAIQSDLDRAMPAWQFDEHHEMSIRASADQIYRAIKETTADDILFFRTLIWIRRFGRPGPESILDPAANTPLLEVATRTTFTTLSDTPREIVVGTPVVAPRIAGPRRKPTAAEFVLLRDRPGFALAAMNFAIRDCAGGACRITTETRVLATDPSTARAFRAYWRIIYPGSALIRRMWLRAIKKRAETQPS